MLSQEHNHTSHFPSSRKHVIAQESALRVIFIGGEQIMEADCIKKRSVRRRTQRARGEENAQGCRHAKLFSAMIEGNNKKQMAWWIQNKGHSFSDTRSFGEWHGRGCFTRQTYQSHLMSCSGIWWCGNTGENQVHIFFIFFSQTKWQLIFYVAADVPEVDVPKASAHITKPPAWPHATGGKLKRNAKIEHTHITCTVLPVVTSPNQEMSDSVFHPTNLQSWVNNLTMGSVNKLPLRLPITSNFLDYVSKISDDDIAIWSKAPEQLNYVEILFVSAMLSTCIDKTMGLLL